MNGSHPLEVEVRALTDFKDDEGNWEVVWTTLDNADYFGVYLQTGDGTFAWAADFAHYQDAYNWAEEVAENHDMHFVDRCERTH